MLARIGTTLLLACAFSSSDANSDNGSNAVLSVTIHDSGNALITLGSSANTEGCATPALKNYILIPKTNANFNAMYATALLALSTDRPIQGWVNGCTDVWGNGSFVIVTATTISVSK
ncbi:hypothetical protein [Dyella subtropica]|uniref:hypothetical protein n=1 Tax=Dyella subtropica TaxID=2992127 RepID=UPI00225B107A|nr:hypothetical protein [Dyella subtropica]